LEAALKVSPGYLSKISKKNITPDLSLVWNIAKFFNVSVEVLCNSDLRECNDRDLCTFVRAHGNTVECISFDSKDADNEIALVADKLMVPKRDFMCSIYACIPERLKVYDHIEDCVIAYWPYYKQLLGITL